MSKKSKETSYISARESRRISRENVKITKQLDKRLSRKHVPEKEYLTTMRDPNNVVEFDNLHTYFFTDVGTVKAVDGVTFEVPVGKTVGIVGESGCGKSVTSLSLMQLVQRPNGQIVDGAIRLNLGDRAFDVAKMPIEAMQKVRGNVVSMIFQEPMTSLNPVFRIGDQVDEVLLLHNEENRSKEEIKAYIIREFGYDLSRTCDEIRPTYYHIESCQKTVPEALTAFMEGTDFEDVIRTAVSLGGDCDTLTCIAGGMAEAYYGIPDFIKTECRRRLPDDMKAVCERFEKMVHGS